MCALTDASTMIVMDGVWWSVTAGFTCCTSLLQKKREWIGELVQVVGLRKLNDLVAHGL